VPAAPAQDTCAGCHVGCVGEVGPGSLGPGSGERKPSRNALRADPGGHLAGQARGTAASYAKSHRQCWGGFLPEKAKPRIVGHLPICAEVRADIWKSAQPEYYER
jgi:hypothetical protein